MNSNSDGLSPTLRPQLGVGWNRALPGAFGFDKGIFPDGTNDVLRVPSLERGIEIPNFFSIEYWIDSTNYFLSGIRQFFSLYDFVNTRFLSADNFSGRLQLNANGASGYCSTANNVLPPNAKAHVVYTFNRVTGGSVIYLNGVVASTAGSGGVPNTSLQFKPTRFTLFAQNLTSSSYNQYFACSVDELRFYDILLPHDQIVLNYNSGIGNNPATTENLFAWYQFQQFENLDFSILQDNSDIRLGIRDMSGNNNHAQPINMDTNPSSPTFVLKPF